MANVVILGGSGFLGSVLCEKLVERFGAANARILVPSRHPARARHLLVLPTKHQKKQSSFMQPMIPASTVRSKS